MRQRLGIAVALSGRPDFLVLDESLESFYMNLVGGERHA